MKTASSVVPKLKKMTITNGVIQPVPRLFEIEVVRVARHGHRMLYVDKDGQLWTSGDYSVKIKHHGSIWPVLVRLGFLTQEQIAKYKAEQKDIDVATSKMYSAESLVSTAKELNIVLSTDARRALRTLIRAGKAAQKRAA